MAETAIEWADAVWNPVTGCSKVSPGCAHCYAEALTARRAGGPGWIEEHRPWTPANAEHNVRLRPGKLTQPLSWRKPRMVFVNSMSDLFHELVPVEFLAEAFAVMGTARRHTFQVLTKRPERARDVLLSGEFRELLDHGVGEFPYPNVWLGTSIENRRFVGRADALREAPAAVRFISAEPLLGPLVWPRHVEVRESNGFDYGKFESPSDHPQLDLAGIDWLIAGGESGPGHRRFDERWAADLLAACRASGTAFFMKQVGGHRPGTSLEDLPEGLRVREWPAPVEAQGTLL